MRFTAVLLLAGAASASFTARQSVPRAYYIPTYDLFLMLIANISSLLLYRVRPDLHLPSQHRQLFRDR